MALIDLPLEQLKVYKGTNPKPADFDQFWEKGLEQMRALDPDVKITPADFKCSFADCFDMYFTGLGGARIYAKLIKPGNIDGKAPALLHFHGYSGSSGDWTDKLAYAAQGFVVAAMDCRGQGGKSEDNTRTCGMTHRGHIIRGLDDGPENLLFRRIFLDTAQLAGIVMDMDCVDRKNVCAKGGSQGGGLAVACAALEPGIKRLVPLYPFLSDYQRVWHLDFCTAAYVEMREYFRRFDPLHQRQQDIFTRLGYIDVQHLADRIKGDVLMAVTLRDDVTPPSSQFAVYNKIKSEKHMLLYHDFGHESLPQAEDHAFKFITDSL